MSAPKLAYRDLPPDLQAVWLGIYGAVLAGPDEPGFDLIAGKPARAEREAWEAVRRANGGEDFVPSAPVREDESIGEARRRLERRVVEASKAWRAARLGDDHQACMRTVRAAEESVDGLVAFEAEHGGRP